MKLVTVATHSERYFPYLLKSCERFDIDLVVLGWNQKWNGFLMKYNLMNEYLQTLDDEEIVCFVDALDVIVLEPLSKLEMLYRDSGKQIVVAIEQHNNIFNLAYFGKCEDTPINSGTYIGKAVYLKLLLKNICLDYDCTNNRLDDQRILTTYCRMKRDPIISLDYDQTFFLTALPDVNRKTIIIIDKKLTYKNHTPCILHAAGKHSIDKIILDLGYDICVGEVLHKKVRDFAIWNIFGIIPLKLYTIISVMLIIIVCIVYGLIPIKKNLL